MRFHFGENPRVLSVGSAVVACIAICTGRGFAQESEFKPTWPKFGYEMRTGATYDDKGFQKVDGAADPSKSLTMGIERAKLKITGDVATNVSYYVRAGLSPTANALDYALLTAKLTDSLSVGIGRTYVHFGGWEYYYLNSDYVGSVTPFLSGKTAIVPFYAATAIEVNYKLAGTISLQLHDDTTMVRGAAGRTSGGYFTETSKQPAANIQWMGDLGALKPIIQYGSYDTNHSTMYTVGLGYKQDQMFAWINYSADNQVKKVDIDKKETDVRTNISFHGEYQIGDYKPFVRGLIFDIKQGGTDLKANTSATVKDLAAEIDDNLTNFSLGMQYMAWGEAFKPYLGYVTNQASFYKDRAANSDVKSTKSQGLIKLGVMSKM